MAFTKIAAAGIGSTGTVTLQNIIVTGSVSTPSITGAASTENVRTNSLSVSGVTTSSGGFVGNVTGNATGLSGTPNITVGSIIASSATISGNVSVAGTLTYEDVTNIDSIGVVTARSSVIVGAGLSVVGVTTLSSAGGITTTGGSLFTKQLDVLGSSSTAKLNLSGISSSISSTAVDVFVYDTRKDSDGGQWRKRTQHTSWYNETLNTATRGSRRDFPAVAVIVATTSSVTIYDGDDPDMPMWMVFTVANNTWLKHTDSSNISISMINGILASGGSGGTGRLSVINFISDNGYVSEPGYNYKHDTISTRNTTSVGPAIGNIFIVNIAVNDVAMTVLPNAPIDSATGLPVPTIAVATDGGASVIKDDGNVWDIGYNDGTGDQKAARIVEFSSDSTVLHILNKQGTLSSRYTNVINFDDQYYGTNAFSVLYGATNPSLADTLETRMDELNSHIALNGTSRLSIVNQQRVTVSSNIDRPDMVAYATTSYNTGWMHGNIKGAWLSDTSTASVTGTELVTNGTFTSNVTGWSTQANATLTWDAGSGGQAKVVTSASSNTGIYQTVSGLTIGQKYAVFCAINAPSGTINLAVYTDTGFGTLVANVNGTGNNAYQTLSLIFTATTTSVVIITGVSAAVTSYRDNISLRLLSEPDRSVNNNGLAVYGTITKSAVATGSNLVAYSGFNTTTNYLEQPYNSSLSFGTGDFSVTCWYYNNTGTEIRVQRTTGGANGWAITLGNAGGDLYIHNGDFSTFASFAGLSNTGVWNHFTFVRRYNDKWYIYKNGVLSGTTTTLSGTNFNDVGTFKVHASSGNSPNSIALLRVSSTVPSPTQIAKIYNDEKALFQPNSQCTLYGSSDAVTALAYDDTTKLLSVGTSSGRSDFQGLERINNTTTAVTTAISASNGLIAEQ